MLEGHHSHTLRLQRCAQPGSFPTVLLVLLQLQLDVTAGCVQA